MTKESQKTRFYTILHVRVGMGVFGGSIALPQPVTGGFE